MKLTRIPIEQAIFSQPVVLHPRFGAQLSIFGGKQKNKPSFTAEVSYIPEIAMIETIMHDIARDPDGHKEVRYVNIANTVMINAVGGMIELEQQLRKKRGPNDKQKASNAVTSTSNS